MSIAFLSTLRVPLSIASAAASPAPPRLICISYSPLVPSCRRFPSSSSPSICLHAFSSNLRVVLPANYTNSECSEREGALSLCLLLGKPTNSLPQRGIEFGVLEGRLSGRGVRMGWKWGHVLIGRRQDFLKDAERKGFD